jgi:hypothetical protein
VHLEHLAAQVAQVAQVDPVVARGQTATLQTLRVQVA